MLDNSTHVIPAKAGIYSANGTSRAKGTWIHVFAGMTTTGFTLLEVLIALFIFTIVALIMTKALHNVISIQSSTDKVATRLSETQLALMLFTRDIEQTIDRPVSNSDGNKEEAFIGTRSAITFTHTGFANPRGEAQTSNLQRSRYRVDKNQFIRDTWTELDHMPPGTPHSRVLLTQVQQLYFRYMDKKNIFHAYWPLDGNGEKSLPRAVELRMKLTNGGELQQLFILPQQQVGTHE